MLAFDVYDLVKNKDGGYFDLAIRVIQILGYGYGSQSHTSKSSSQAQILLFYMVLSFALISYNAYNAYYNEHMPDMVSFVFNVGNFLVNILLTRSIYKFYKVLKGKS